MILKYKFVLLTVLCWICINNLLVSQDLNKSPLLGSWPQYLEHKANTAFGMQWIQLGPVVNSARAESVQGDPFRPGVFYAAFGSGNLWKTVNNGLTWKAIFENQSALGIGDIALAPSNPDIIYLGSGESLKKARNFTMPGTGVFRSDNGGETWRNLGLHDSWHIGEIVIHPEHPDTAFVAVLGHFWSSNENRGVYRTLDGGLNWEHVLYVDEKTGANDIVISPSDPNILYASMWENYPGVFGPESGVYRSSDGGANWTKLPNGFPTGPKTGRIGLAVSCQDPDKIYALVDNLNHDKNKAAECYKSVDGGNSWSRTHDKDLSIFPGIGWYFTDCYVNPQDDDEVYLLGVRAAKSKDGGKTFEMIGGDIFHINPSQADPLHLDQCELWINPLYPANLMLANDGGVYISYDKGDTWMHHNNIPAGEFYDISVDNQDPYFVYGGVQDDASVYGPSEEWNPIFPDGWRYIWVDAWSGGDGCVTLPDPLDPNIIYTSSQNGGIFRKDMLADKSKHIQPRLPKGSGNRLEYNFVAPYIISPHHPTTLYHAGNFVFKSPDKGDNWELISPDLSNSSIAEKVSVAAGAIAESPIQAGLLFVGTDKGAVWLSEDDGKSWMERSSGLPNQYIRSICPSRFDSERVYLAATGINEDDLNTYVFVSEDLGKEWIPIKGNLPGEIANVILEDPVLENVLYAGMYRGVYLSIDRGGSWSLLGTNMAATCISDLVIQEREMDLVAGTHGRGIYKINLNPIHEFLEDSLGDGPRLFKAPNGWAPWYNDTHRDVNQRSVRRTSFSFWLPNQEVVKLKVVKGNKKVFEKEIEGKSGINQFRWDLVIKENTSDSPYFIHFKEYLAPGEYAVKLVGEGFEKEQLWVVKPGEIPHNW